MNRLLKTELLSNWVKVPTSELGVIYRIGEVIESWSGNIKIRWTDKDGVGHIGIHSILTNQIIQPSMTDWIEYAESHGAFE